ncbi:TIGR03757 family integrating conjugative element protein [Luteimonas sp. XNQY3]|nr:TIGR03757 family integrating conjugative element protein [Luteimonas sp. XNQY3]MCD9007482.1 TIGR03757 family integrating conjugative element protein [Luteimonas sp. XNQY3]
MPFPVLTSPALRRCWLALAVVAALIGPASANDIIVVTDSGHPVRAPANVRVIELDRAARLEAELAADLPANPAEAATLVQQRLRDGGLPLQRRLADAWQDVADAWSLGVAKLPAVVVDRRYVVYGEPDTARAVARIEAFRSTQP